MPGQGSNLNSSSLTSAPQENLRNGTRCHGGTLSSAQRKQQKKVQKLRCQEDIFAALSRALFTGNLSQNNCVFMTPHHVTHVFRCITSNLKFVQYIFQSYCKPLCLGSIYKLGFLTNKTKLNLTLVSLLHYSDLLEPCFSL